MHCVLETVSRGSVVQASLTTNTVHSAPLGKQPVLFLRVCYQVLGWGCTAVVGADLDAENTKGVFGTVPVCPIPV